ncbi:hypothetical protein, partial [Streptomyces sp. E5N91]|uniref:hypothetical protein n=1 Tax=Streptomyces sp. E5N91 TaxID=1851996 RepID=UPI001EE97CF2
TIGASEYSVASPRLSTAGTHRTDYVTSDRTFTWSEEAMLYPVVFSTSGPGPLPGRPHHAGALVRDGDPAAYQ